MCLMIWLMVGWKSSLMASEDIRSIPWDDHFTKLTLGRERGSGAAPRQRLPPAGPYLGTPTAQQTQEQSTPPAH